MANITEVSQWENVIRQLENGEAATGGADGLANIQAKQLANRTKWLKENYLPLTGGKFNEGNIYISKKGNDGRLVLTGSNSPGGSIELFGSESMVEQGKTILRARDGSAESALYIYPDGSLMHQAVKHGSYYDLAGSAVVAKSLGVNGYVKYASGLIIQWGAALCKGGTKPTIVTLPLSFTANEYRTIICPMCTNAETTVKPVAAFDTNRTFNTFGIISANDTHIEYIAIGR